mgnify:CR=1 FL=1
MLKIGQTSHTLFADESDEVIPWTALQARSQKSKSPFWTKIYLVSLNVKIVQQDLLHRKQFLKIL